MAKVSDQVCVQGDCLGCRQGECAVFIQGKWTRSWRCSRASPRSQPASRWPLWVFRQQWDTPCGDRCLGTEKAKVSIYDIWLTFGKLDIWTRLTVRSADSWWSRDGLHLDGIIKLFCDCVTHGGAGNREKYFRERAKKMKYFRRLAELNILWLLQPHFFLRMTKQQPTQRSC